MKKIVFISGVISISLTTIGILFKVQHIPRAGPLILVDITLFLQLFVATLA